MDLNEVVARVTSDLVQSLPGFAPEIVLVATIVLMLIVPLFFRTPRFNANGLASLGTLLALALAVFQLTPQSAAWLPGSIGNSFELFGGSSQQGAGLLRFDSFTVFFRLFLLSFTALVIWLTNLTGIPDREDSPDFYTLLLGATLGMSLMASANHLLMVFIAVEMASLPSYAMAGFLKGRRDASEAALKYSVYGAGASGIMLYGISLLVGKYGTAHLPTLAASIANSGSELDGVLMLGLVLLLVGVAFKIAAVPFHFWCPDVFEGAAAEVAAFLSVASKAAGLALLVRLSMTLSFSSSVVAIAGRPPVAVYLGAIIALLAAITATYGNLAAYAQTNLKRLLAFSTIAHAGYMMMAVAAAISMGRQNPSSATEGIKALLFYMLVYLFMNLGAFAVVALIRNAIRSEELKDYGGLIRRYPLLTVAMAVFLLSLTGIPPLAGFAAKFRIFYVLFEAKLYWLLIVGLVNTVFSLFYYVKVLRVMIIDEAAESLPSGWSLSLDGRLYCGFLIAFNFGLMLVWGAWDGLEKLSEVAVGPFWLKL